MNDLCPLLLQKQTCAAHKPMSALCQKLIARTQHDVTAICLSADKQDARQTVVHGRAIRLVHPQAHPLRASASKTPYGAPLFDGAGVIGFGDDEPEPSVLGRVAVRLAVVVCEESLLAMLLFQLARVIKPISSSDETAATQPHTPPTLSWRRITGSKRGSSSIMEASLVRNAFRLKGNPLAITAVPMFRREIYDFSFNGYLRALFPAANGGSDDNGQ